MMNRIFPIEFELVWFGGPPKSSWLSSIMMRLSGDRVPRLHATNPSWQTGVVRVRGRTDRELDYFVWLGTRYETAATARHPRPDEFADPTQALPDYRRKYLEKMLPVKPGLSPVQQLKVT
jgi:hypothetical protein